MEIPSVRRLVPQVGQEKYQMLELNRRLETYLGHVKLLEEENQLLRGEIQALKRSRDPKGQRKALEDAIGLARKEVQEAWMKKDWVELEVCNLLEEMEALNAERQKERAAQAEAKKKLEESKKKMEDERRVQIWLREQAAHLEKEAMLQVQVHQEEMANIMYTKPLSRPVMMEPLHSPIINLQGLGEEYSQRATQAWQEAASVYQRQVEQLEDSLNQSRASMVQISQEKKENQLFVGNLAKELENAKVKRELLEKNLAEQRFKQNQELQQLQAQVEALESDKEDLREQISSLLVDTRQLLQMKMCLGLEVATYRALLDSESMRVHSQPTFKTSNQAVSFLEVFPKPQGTHPSTRTVSASSQFSLPLTASSIMHSKADLMTKTPSWSLTQHTYETHKKVEMTGEEENGINEGKTTLERITTTIQTRPLTESGSVPFTSEKAHEEVSYVPTLSDSVVPPAAEEHAKSLEDGEEEEIEVSTEMAQISHAPMFAWEENDTATLEERDIMSELELESEDISEKYTQECRADTTDLNQLGESTEKLASPQIEQASLSSLDTLSHSEKKSEALTWAQSATNVLEPESTNSMPEREKASTETGEGMDQTDEVKAEVEHCGTEFQEGHNLDVELQEEKNLKQLELQSEDISEKYKQECRADATDLNQLGEDTEKLASTQIEHTSLSSLDTLSHIEKKSETLTWAQNVTNVPKIRLFDNAQEIEKASKERGQGMDQTDEVKDEAEVEHCDTELQDSDNSDVELQEENLKHLELESEDISEKYKQECRANATDLNQLGENPEKLASPQIEQASLSFLDTLSHSDKKSDLLTWAQSATNVLEQESADSMPDIEKASMERWEGMDQAEGEDEPDVEHCGTELQEDVHSDFEMQVENYLKQLGENTDKPASPLFEQASLSSLDTLSHGEKKSETLTSVANFPEVESINTVMEIEKVSTEGWQGIDQTENVEDEAGVEHCGMEVQEGHHYDAELQDEEEKNYSEKRIVEDRKKEEVTEADEEEWKKEEDIAVIDESFANTEKEAMVQDFPASVVGVEPHRYLDPTEQTAELVMETYDKERMKEEGIAVLDESFTNTDKEAMVQDFPASVVGVEPHRYLDPTEQTDELVMETYDKERMKEEGIAVLDESFTNTEKEAMVQDSSASVVGVEPHRYLDPTEQTDELVMEKYDKERMKEEGIAVLDESFTNTEKEAMVKDSSASVVGVEPQRYLGPTDQTAEFPFEMHDKDPIDEDGAEEQVQSDDESLNISASWRTDPGEADSYAQENTLADTRPLIHYKSDEDTDANTQASHIGVSEPSDSEDEREKLEGVSLLGQYTKRFDTMEDLSEEPEIANSDDAIMEDSAQSVVETNNDEMIPEQSTEALGDDILQSESDDMDVIVNTPKDDALVDLAENDFSNCEGSIQGVEETEKHVLLVQKQEEISHIQDWSQTFPSETKDMNEQLPISGGESGTNPFTQIKSEEEAEGDSDHFPIIADTTLSEEFQEQAPTEEACEVPSTETTLLDAIPSKTNMIEEQACAKEDKDEQSNVSVPTHADITDNLSLINAPSSQPGSQTNAANRDSEESNSSEDESPNASQCFQLHSHAGISAELLDFGNTGSTTDVSENVLRPFTGFLEEEMKKSLEEDKYENDSATPSVEQENVYQNKDEPQLAAGNSSNAMGENTSNLSQTQQWEDLDLPNIITGASNNTISTVEELSDMTTENTKASESMDPFQCHVLNDEPQMKGKENDLHSFFCSSIKEDLWATTNFGMSATYDSNEPEGTDGYSAETIKPNQGWGELESLKPANGKHEKEMSISTAQLEEDGREEQKIPQAKQLQCRKGKDGQVETAHSDDSVDDGDSWSSGEE